MLQQNSVEEYLVSYQASYDLALVERERILLRKGVQKWKLVAHWLGRRKAREARSTVQSKEPWGWQSGLWVGLCVVVVGLLLQGKLDEVKSDPK